MPTIEGELETFTEEASLCADLDGFSCGDKRHAYEETVEKIIAYHRANVSSGKTLRVTRELPGATLVGLSIISWKFGPKVRHRFINEDEYRDAAYVDVVTLSNDYRGGFTCKDGTSVSDFLLTETLQYIEEHEGKMPIVQALIEEANDHSRDLCARHGFEQPFVTSPDLLYVRLPDAE